MADTETLEEFLNTWFWAQLSSFDKSHPSADWEPDVSRVKEAFPTAFAATPSYASDAIFEIVRDNYWAEGDNPTNDPAEILAGQDLDSGEIVALMRSAYEAGRGA